jgi:DNA-binding XRE family transcriptional regulator
MKNNNPHSLKEVLEEEIKCPICGEILRRRLERGPSSFLIEQYRSKIKEPYDQFHFVSSYSLAHLFLQRRVDQNLTIESFSKKIGFSENYIKSVEHGKIIPSLKYSLVCAEEFGINPNWIKNRWVKEMTSWFEQKLMNRFNLKEEI